MPPFGKSWSGVHGMADRVKGGLAWARHQYRAGMHLASKTNDLYHTVKRIASLFMPELDAIGVGEHMRGGFGAMDHMRDRAIQRHSDVLDRLRDNSDVIGRLREAKTFAQPYLS